MVNDMMLELNIDKSKIKFYNVDHKLSINEKKKNPSLHDNKTTITVQQFTDKYNFVINVGLNISKESMMIYFKDT
jgi:hypothetical protein